MAGDYIQQRTESPSAARGLGRIIAINALFRVILLLGGFIELSTFLERITSFRLNGVALVAHSRTGGAVRFDAQR